METDIRELEVSCHKKSETCQWQVHEEAMIGTTVNPSQQKSDRASNVVY